MYRFQAIFRLKAKVGSKKNIEKQKNQKIKPTSERIKNKTWYYKGTVNGPREQTLRFSKALF